MSIERDMHFIWVGPNTLPASLIGAWRDMHPSWEVHVWREPELAALGLVNQRAFDAYLTGKRWHGAANVARYEIVHRWGGVYIDVDTVPLRPFDRGPFMKPGVSLFAGYVQPRTGRPGLIGNAYIGAEPEHPVLAECISRIGKLTHLVPPYRQTGVYLFTDAVEAVADESVRIMPTHTFFPHDKVGADAPGGRGASYAEHLWGSTRVSEWEYPRG